jgi:hypothetical protein
MFLCTDSGTGGGKFALALRLPGGIYVDDRDRASVVPGGINAMFPISL